MRKRPGTGSNRALWPVLFPSSRIQPSSSTINRVFQHPRPASRTAFSKTLSINQEQRASLASSYSEFQELPLKKIGIIFGMETTFPPALVEKINSVGAPGIQAELAQVGEVRMAEPSPYHVIIDRISHDIPFYRAYLKNAALSGTIVINNPFWWSADDKFFNYALGQKLGVAIPPTVLIPHKEHPAGTTDRSMRNLQFPMPWDSIFSYVRSEERRVGKECA